MPKLAGFSVDFLSRSVDPGFVCRVTSALTHQLDHTAPTPAIAETLNGHETCRAVK
ncbi:MAG TPA: hypothetical protein VIU82_01850 [Bosea sp. (in: a-proteobacteria)]